MRTLLAAVAGVVAVVAMPGAAVATPGPGNAPEYWFDSWNIPTLWRDGARGAGITIAEIDTGVNASIAPLAGKVLKGKDFGDSGGDGRVDRDVDEFGHGTAMASIMVGAPGVFGITGIAPSAKILPIAIPLAGTTDQQPDDHLAEAITWATDHGANIVNLSLGGKRTPSGDDQSCSTDEQDAIFDALRKGVVVVASIGNTGPTNNIIEEPAVCLGVVSVAAVDATGAVAPFSTRQPYVTVSAPGVNIPSLSRVDGVAYSGEGTSQATAIVSAVLALVWSKHRSLSGRDVVARLLATLDETHRPPSSSYGYGIVDAYRAVTSAVVAGGPNPVYDAAAPFITRADAFAQAVVQPKPASTSLLGDAGYAVHSPSRTSHGEVKAGLGLAGAGVLALLAFGFAGVRGRRRRPVEDVPLPEVEPVAEGAKRPRPGPRQEGS